MSQDAPLVSVLIPAYNAQKYIEESIRSTLTQTYKNLQVIIVNDASTDRTGAIIEQFRLQDSRIELITNTSNLKMSLSLNKGLAQARGKYIARMDADDISLPERISRQVAYMESHPEVGISGTSMKIVDEDLQQIGIRSYYLTDAEIRKHIFKFSPFCHPSIIMRKDVLDKAGGYEHEYNPAEDYELYFRLGMHSKFGNIPDFLLMYRTVPNSMTTGGINKMENMTTKIKLKYLVQYNARTLDYILTYAQLYMSKFIPPKLKFKLFVYLRAFFAQAK
ncbi:MAG: hypothetical protein RLY61_473 [Candidatus Parcubacteria bacterium]|jgi:glycosyltransferase involved in cell wall biosynthesis